MNFNITAVSEEIKKDLQHKIDFLTKPLGALGRLESIAKKVGTIQNTLRPELKNPYIVVCAGDHGIAKEGVSPFPQEVTFQMVLNFLNGGAGINVFARQNDIKLKIVDAGVNYNFNSAPGLIDAKIGLGTKSFSKEPAMTKEQCESAIQKGAELVEEIFDEGSNIVGFGEMGISNTSSAAIILSKICDVPIESAVGRGAGVDDIGLQNKIKILSDAINKHKGVSEPLEVLRYFGGFEIAMLCGAMLKAAELKMILMIDGFIITSALLVAQELNKNVLDYCVFGHKSNEQGHTKMLEYLNADPILDLGMRLGEGTGAAVAYPIIKSAVNMINEMASFESANVSNKDD